MRNVFDQYGQPENRLTHALLCSLDADRRLLHEFVRWVTARAPAGDRLTVDEQSFPDGPDSWANHGDASGVPDGCIADNSGWALLIESKLVSRWNVDQLRRHRATAERHGLTDVTILCLIVGRSPQAPPLGCLARSWTEVYEWLSQFRPRSEWARRCRHYFEVAEAQLVEANGLPGGAITMFTGIPFGVDEPYTYLQAKRLLGLLRQTLLADSRLVRALDVDVENPGRGAITGSKERRVWDYIGLMSARHVDAFTKFPHLTLGILDDRLEAMVTVPNGVSQRLRRAMLGALPEEFAQRIGDVVSGIRVAESHAPGLKPIINVVQRHYASQHATPVYDAVLRFDPRTAVCREGAGRVKAQPQWLPLAFEVLNRRSSNLQFQIGAEFPYEGCETVRSPAIATAVAAVWKACRPLLVQIRSAE